MKNITTYIPYYLLLMLSALLSFGCQGEQFDVAKLNGEWKVDSWKVLSSGDSRTNKMDMTFDADGRYEVDYGSEKEQGKYWIANEYLHTVEDGQTDKKVKIMTLSKDTLFFQMNRGGELENVLLLRK